MIFLNFFNRLERRAFFERVTGSTVRCSMSQEHAKFAVEKELDESVKARNLQLGASKLLPSLPPPLFLYFSPPHFNSWLLCSTQLYNTRTRTWPVRHFHICGTRCETSTALLSVAFLDVG